ncbi:MAG: hypothetical protein LH468_02270 [Nocardioides sp.]|nr:hypothetical protein [Nocardioides sp.]
MNRLRYAGGALGVLVGGYGAYLALTRQDLDQLLSLGLWLVSGLVVHDAILAPVVLGLAFGFRAVPEAFRRPATVALVVLGSLSVLAVPVIGRFGARPDNATLLDRPYVVSWAVLVALGVVAVLVAGRLGSSRTPATQGGGDGDGAGRG